jgi:hypothetical protein
MSKSAITRLFAAAVIALVIGVLIALVTVVGALAGGVVTLGGPAVVTVEGGAIPGTVGWLMIASLAMAGGALAAIVSWMGALMNTIQLEDKTWFLVLLVLGLASFGWIAMAAYVLAGPDATNPTPTRPGVAATPGTSALDNPQINPTGAP